MKHVFLGFPNNEWGVLFTYDFDVNEEYEELMEQMRSFGLTILKARYALNILSGYNTGMAISNDTLKMSAIYISKATSPSQFWDSCAHELAHTCTAIIDSYGVDYRSEDAAYLSGYLMRQLVEKIGEPCY